MILQEKRILCDKKEPDKNHLWLRPRLDRDGYDLLYWGANGWTPLIDCSACPFKENHPIPVDDNMDKTTIVNGDVLVEIPDGAIEGVEGNIYEFTPPSLSLPEQQKPSCGCPDITIKPM